MDRPGVAITGGTRGLGFALADAFLGLGTSVAISGRSAAAVTEAVERLRATHPGMTVTGVAGDIATYEGCQALWSAATQACGRVDLWINNAGTSTAPVPLAQTSPAEIAATVATNLTGTMNGARVAIEGMLAQGHGQVCNVEGFGSSGSKRTGMSVYGATKAAVRYFTRSLVKELTGSPVIISTLVPGLMATEMLAIQYAVATPRRRRVYDSIADRPETIAAGVAPRLLANRKNGAVVSWLGPREIAKRLIVPAWRKRGLLGGTSKAP